ncbi:cytochrome P450 [Tothia fuscella]|uniref:Cytochrome P450 n=1 Tax=Tothia fuscella TaxID=1048955 RepID=A0A9P4NLX6_9PEZI|nr:cytochrome P450 [Tothia fuscella]
MEGVGLFGQKIILTAEPKIVQAVLATKFKDFETGARRRGQFGALLGYSIFTSDGDFWAHSRALFRPVFSRESINDLEETERASRILMDVLPMDGNCTERVDLMPYFYRFTLDTATAFLFGETTDSQLAAAGRLGGAEKSGVTSMAADQEFADAFTVAQEWVINRLRVQQLYWLLWSPRWAKAVATVRNFVNQYVKIALEQDIDPKQAESGDGDKYNILHELVKDTRDPIELRDQILALLAAGRDTTAVLLSWTFMHLSQNPTIFQSLRSQILQDFGTSSTSKITFSQLKSCRQIQWVLNETLRVNPVVPVNNRVAVRNTVLPVGGGEDSTKPLAVRKGQMINFVPYQIQRRKDLWGEDADVWRPDRWDGKKIDWSFVPFSGGPRICLGQQYAITEASFLVVRMLQEFDDIEWLGKPGKVKKGLGLTMFPAEGVPVRLRKASL